MPRLVSRFAAVLAVLVGVYVLWLADVESAGDAVFLVVLAAAIAAPFAVLARWARHWRPWVSVPTLVLMTALAAAILAPSSLESSSTAAIALLFVPFGAGALLLLGWVADRLTRRRAGAAPS